MAQDRPDIPIAKLDKLRELMKAAVPDCLTAGHETLIPVPTLPDADDRHVRAAAVRGGDRVIVTANMRDFPDSERVTFGAEAKYPDEFVLDLSYLDGVRVHQVVNSPRLRDGGVGRSSARIALLAGVWCSVVGWMISDRRRRSFR
ncbi:hypothetical protein ACIGKR_31890 [Rhodococcus qingshengii]|uniref:hypothetical protein n=1 Tax=Rhodococcus qingshengii TaxID=334542 RepID=UPI0037CA3AD7